MKKLSSLLLFAIFLNPLTTFSQDCHIPSFPQAFKLEETLNPFVTNFEVKGNNGQNLGTVEEKFISLTATFTYKDSEGNLVATAKKALLSWGTKIEVFDCKGRLIGTLQEKIFESLFKTYTNYAILDANSKEVATSEKLDWLATAITLKNPSGQVLAEMKRPMFNVFTDTWNITVSSQNTVDSRIVVVLAAFKTKADDERRSSDDN